VGTGQRYPLAAELVRASPRSLPLAAGHIETLDVLLNPPSLNPPGLLEIGLQAQVYDPLWLLGRQWQMRKFDGEDAGSPILVRLTGETAPVTCWRPLRATAAADVPAGHVGAEHAKQGQINGPASKAAAAAAVGARRDRWAATG
jgi:hypothetical protein